MRSMAVINQKGGCGKTITVINLSAFLAREQRKVLVVDMDPQGHATLGLQIDSTQPAKTVSDVLLRGKNEEPRLRDVTRSVLPNLDLVPADIWLSAVPEKLSAVFGREQACRSSRRSPEPVSLRHRRLPAERRTADIQRSDGLLGSDYPDGSELFLASRDCEAAGNP